MWSISTKYLLFLLRQHWFIAIYQFHVYNLIFYLSIHYSMHTTKHFVSSQSLIPIFAFPPVPSLLVTTTLSSVSVFIYLFCSFIYLFILFVCFLYPTYKWNQVVFFFLHLTHFILKNTCKVHPCYCKWQISSLLWLRIFTLCVCVCNIFVYSSIQLYDKQKYQSMYIIWHSLLWMISL